MPSNEGSNYNINLKNQNGSRRTEQIPTVNEKNEKNNKRNDVDFDDLLPHVGEFHRYQKILFLLMIPFAFFVAWVYFSQIFITLIPEEHWCRVPGLDNLTLHERIALTIPVVADASGSSYDKCRMYDVDFSQLIKNGTIPTANPSWPTKKCEFGWEYNFTDIPYETIATEYDWVCDDAALPTLAQSIFFVGAICGGLIFGWIADRHGRIPALVGCNIVGCIAGIFTAFTSSFWQFAACRFFVGFAFDNCFTMMYILVLEYVGPKWRTFVANMSIALFFTFAACILPWVAYFLADWRMTAIATSLPLALAILTPFLVPESARWLVSMGKIDKAIEILHKFERINGRKIPDNVMQDFKDTCEQVIKDEKDNTYSVISLFKSPRLRNITILLIVIWMAISLVFDGHVRNVDNLGLNVFITFTVAAATELPADTFLTLVLDRWGRRWLACGSMVISGIFSIWACAVSDQVYSASLAIMGRFCVNISYNIGLQYAAELLPTVVRAQGVALIHTMGYVASIASPFVVYLAGIDPILPLLLLGIFGIIGGIMSLFLPETLDKDLPQTLQDGEDFGKDQGIWDMPCLMKKVDDDEERPEIIRSYRMDSIRGSWRASLRGEALRSSMIQRSSARSRSKRSNTPVEVVRL